MGQSSSRIAFTLLGSQKEKREKGSRKLLFEKKIIAENFPLSENETDAQIQEIQEFQKRKKRKRHQDTL